MGIIKNKEENNNNCENKSETSVYEECEEDPNIEKFKNSACNNDQVEPTKDCPTIKNVISPHDDIELPQDEDSDNLECKIKRYSLREIQVNKEEKDNKIFSPYKDSNNTILGKKSKINNLSVYTVTWNMFGQTSSVKEIELLLPKDNFYHIYAIGTEECMRSILFSMFYIDKSFWEEMTQ